MTQHAQLATITHMREISDDRLERWSQMWGDEPNWPTIGEVKAMASELLAARQKLRDVTQEVAEWVDDPASVEASVIVRSIAGLFGSKP